MSQFSLDRYRGAEFATLSNLPADFRAWNGILRTIGKAACGVSEDLCMVMDKHDKLPETPEAKDFIQACDYYHWGILSGPFQSAKLELQPFLDEPAHYGMRGLTMGELLLRIEEQIRQLRADIEEIQGNGTIDAWGFKLRSTSPGVQVPTASPYQLAHELLFALQGLESGLTDDPVTEKALLEGLVKRAKLDLPAPRKGRAKATTTGRPAMVYLSIVKGKIIFGASGLLWEQYLSAKNITTRARESRLNSIIGPASTAMRVLKAKEGEEQGEIVTENRRLAIEKTVLDPAFLGGYGGRGLAYKPLDWKPRLPCYFCQGVYGCVSVLDWTAEEKAKNLLDSK
ncbi:hypothetical protein CONLIGDRAFT_108619 [Coniochaeta ligniaria NRRL 30616]|uniref:Uncharacterized protein n=1 Tax=Coniochaeta ligniaria NRRL 30616 TaxID=1408157 RepID=A0A1J7IT93_9PEZI|nr:hypothetical protein CONLIGDRAFT_108619 [Coniochaeta ligniaria NRRL 30616]